MRPCGPVPATPSRSTCHCEARRRARGLAKRRPPGTRVFEAGAGAGACGAGLAAGAAGAAAGWAGAAAAPLSARACSMADASSPAASSTPITVLTGTDAAPAGTTMRPSTPACSALISTMAFSVSISASASPTATASPSFLSHWCSVPPEVSAATEGSLIRCATLFVLLFGAGQVRPVGGGVVVFDQFQHVPFGVAEERQPGAGPDFHRGGLAVEHDALGFQIAHQA
ncbi:hypothetical protein AGI3411_05491 [Achromobacter agilis]|uniref:Uncharacterized protein n=1 Tax=Achromobacter agilis TaxID=1353888 RepID=A0A446CWF2_9BURK|nr:hypothetical protein AGI3411_05491 [Achromobacter agilis]